VEPAVRRRDSGDVNTLIEDTRFGHHVRGCSISAARHRVHGDVNSGFEDTGDTQCWRLGSRLWVNHGAENFSRPRLAFKKTKRREIKKENGRVMKAGIWLKQQASGWSRKVLIQALLS
jgi:hypothetical protein